MRKRTLVAAAAAGYVLYMADEVLMRLELVEGRLNGIDATIDRLNPRQLTVWAGNVNDHIERLEKRLDELNPAVLAEQVLDRFATARLSHMSHRGIAVREGRGFPDPPADRAEPS